VSLRHAPELALLAALSSTLRATIEILSTVHPEAPDHGAEPTIELAAAEAVILASGGLIASIERYRRLFDDDLF